MNHRLIRFLKKILLINSIVFLLITTLSSTSKAQVNGEVIHDDNNFFVIRVWGSHQERGYAQGYLMGDKITDIFRHHVQPLFGKYYPTAKELSAKTTLFEIDSNYIIEAKSLIEGMNKAELNNLGLDYQDILLANTILDLQNIMGNDNHTHCSSLMSWGDATAGTDLDGKSVISRHLDWNLYQPLIRNQVMVIHIPSEQNEQPWAGIGFAGMISVLSGFNTNIGVFQHMMEDENARASNERSYEPIWFSLRKSIEQTDPNADGHNNVMDVKHVLNQRENGFGGNYIISALARSTEKEDSLIAMVAELSAEETFQVYRSNSYEKDAIPGDNLYTANQQIARNNKVNKKKRYKEVRSNLKKGTRISLEQNRHLMQYYSHLSINYQFMTYCPEMDLFRISIRDYMPAYKTEPMDFKISVLFSR